MTEKTKEATKRLQIEMSAKALERLETLRSMSNSSTTAEVCRKAFRLLDTILDYDKKGYTLVIKTEDGQEVPFPITLL